MNVSYIVKLMFPFVYSQAVEGEWASRENKLELFLAISSEEIIVQRHGAV
jgi:hypothetical protein